MSDHESKTEITEEEAKQVLRDAYQLFKQRKYSQVLEVSTRITSESIVVKHDVNNLHSLIWGVIGDSLVALNNVNSAINAYRRSIALDEHSGCIYSYTVLVTKYNLVEQTGFAYDILERYDRYVRSGTARWRVFAMMFSLLFMPKTWVFFYIRMPIARIRLKRMKAQLPDGEIRNQESNF